MGEIGKSSGEYGLRPKAEVANLPEAACIGHFPFTVDKYSMIQSKLRAKSLILKLALFEGGLNIPSSWLSSRQAH
jgi:hypothetical protein